MLPVQSGAEQLLYEALRDQLPADFTCYHGIEWLHLGGRPQEGEADFLIVHPELGVLVLEVKGGQLTYDPPTRTWKRQGDPKPVRDPFAQAQRCMHWLKRELEHLPKKWMPSLGYGVAFPNGEYKEQAHPNAPLDLVVDHRDMGELAARIPKLMRRWQRDDRAFGAEGMRALDQVLGYRVEVLVPLGSRIDEAERRTIDLTPQQSYVRDLLRRPGRFGVTGTAGSGKTIIAIETARWLAKQGHRTLVTCFNKRLATHLAASRLSSRACTRCTSTSSRMR
ncbi:hypothetical protein BH18ACT17_BH18ACT17_14000 [soil metagenome]